MSHIIEKIKINQATYHKLEERILKNRKIQAVAVAKNNLGVEFVFDGEFYGLLHYSSIPKYVQICMGDVLELYVRKVRYDNKIDLIFHPIFKDGRLYYEKLLEVLKENPTQVFEVDKKSSPETIFKMFGMSKKKFKLAIKVLVDLELVSYEDGLMKLIDP